MIRGLLIRMTPKSVNDRISNFLDSSFLSFTPLFNSRKQEMSLRLKNRKKNYNSKNYKNKEKDQREDERNVIL